MNYPEKTLFNKTWVGWLNIFILQWFFIRLQGSIEDKNMTKWQLILPVLPLTGWFSDYKPNNRRTITL